jgi:uncharacterized protein YndB with AHSA1/START domain
VTAAAARAEVVVPAPPHDAFRLFTEDIGLWWRRDAPYWNDAGRAVGLRIEPGVGGRFVELHDAGDGAGFEVGRVTAWEPGRRLAVTWTQSGWDGVATDVEVTFEPAAGGTRVRLAHTGFERVPDSARALAGYDAGWNEILGWYAEAAQRPKEPSR